MSDINTRRIHIKGVVQGVGFRPFVYSTAKELNITGWVRNSSAGVDIVASGEIKNLDLFIDQIENNPPPLSVIDMFEWSECPFELFSDFNILKSKVIPGGFIPISPDIAICADCQHELFDPGDHRYRYPFINCTNCGPRLTIIKDIPYDRPLTTMASFPMCSVCTSEYSNPTNRRFHAQPIACPDCGPQIWFQKANGDNLAGENGLREARRYLKDGKIIAIKGLGGFHLACDATNPTAVKNLRKRKRRSEKPFALMGFDIGAIEKYCAITNPEKRMILSKEKPIVIVKERPENRLPEQIAPGRHTIGVMLAYTPLHLLLLEPEENFPDLFVMTSGNISDEPIAYINHEGMERLNDIADGFLMHDRDIHIRMDDSVSTVINHKPYFFRRSRGFAPRSIPLQGNKISGLAVGPELKNTFCLTKDEYAFVSHHIGDLKNFETYTAFTESVAHYCKIFRISPQKIACDLHPEYLSTKFAREWSQKNNIPLTFIQHHHAHLASCLADNNYFEDSPVIGFIFDGTGYGTDGNIWGGEILVGNIKESSREMHLAEMPLPGGDHAVYHPNRIALAYLIANHIPLGEKLNPIRSFEKSELDILRKQIKQKINVPLTTSMGRLFDAVASLLDIQQSISYEAQAAIEMEQMITPGFEGYYRFKTTAGIIDIGDVLKEILDDIDQEVNAGIISAKFHNSIVDLVVNAAKSLRAQNGINKVALSGGVWQNLYLLKKTISSLIAEGFSVLYHHHVPANDGGVSLGQAAVLAVNN